MSTNYRLELSTRLRVVCMLMLCCPMVMAQKPQRFHKTLPAGNYSGITHLGGDRYAMVSDKSEEDVFYVLHIVVDTIKGRIDTLENEGFCPVASNYLLLVADSQNRYKGFLRDWFLLLPI